MLSIDEIHFGFVPGKGLTDAMFYCLTTVKNLFILLLLIWKRLLTLSQRKAIRSESVEENNPYYPRDFQVGIGDIYQGEKNFW